MSGLYNAFSSPIYNYTSTVSGYFNSTALYDYYRHYGKNYVQDNVTLFTQEAMYRYPIDSRYNAILNDGYLDHDDNAYSFSLPGENIDARLSSSLTQSDLNLVGENDSYHNHLFTLADLSQTFFSTYGFTRISKNKYQYARQFVTDKDNAVFNAFIDLCAPGLNNTGFFMTFSRVTVELNPEENVSMRLRLYAYKTQWGKLLEDHRKETYPNWYLLFSEAEITDIGATNIAPLQGLFE